MTSREQDADDADATPAPELGRRVGYVLKETQAALRARMDEVLRGHGLTVPQYACLELLHEGDEASASPAPVPRELTNAELAREPSSPPSP